MWCTTKDGKVKRMNGNPVKGIRRVLGGFERGEKRPNFLIVGAAKCGTTAVSSYLSQHPQVYLSPIKEPKFISSHFLDFPLKGNGDDFVESFTVKDIKEYRSLFRNAKRHKAIGEASVENLYYYNKSIPIINAYLNSPKIIIILRNPVDRAFSAYKHLMRDNRETLSFEEALDKEDERKALGYEYLWFLKDVGFYHDQVKAYLDSFSEVKVMLFDDLQEDTVGFMRELFRFLGVDDTFIPKVEIKFNASGPLKGSFYQLLFRATAFKGMLYKFFALNGIPESTMLSVVENIRHSNVQPIHMDPATRAGLSNLYRKDIQKLGGLLDRDLSFWLN